MRCSSPPSGRTYHRRPAAVPQAARLWQRDHAIGFAEDVMRGERRRSPGRSSVVVRAAADRVFLPTKNLLEQVGDMMILTGKTLVSALRPPYPYGTEFVQQFLFVLRLCWLPLTISTIAFGYGAPGPAGGQLPRPVRRDRPPRRLLRARLDPRVRAVRDGDHPRRRRRHGDHRRPRRAQDPRGARRAPGARRRPDQEPRRAALPGADDRHRPVQHLRADLRHLRRRAGHADLRRAARPVLRDAAQQRVAPPTSGARW